MDLLEVYLLNLAMTVAMFLVLILRTWIEFKNFKIMWEETKWERTRQRSEEILKAEKDLFMKAEGGSELYDVLCHMFEVEENKH